MNAEASLDQKPDGHAKGGPLAPAIAGIVLLIGTVVLALAWQGGGGGDLKAGGHGGGHGARGGGDSVAPTVAVAPAGEGDLDPVRTVPGTVDASGRWSLRAREAGTLTRTAELGATVERGRIVASIDTGTLPAEIRRAEALVLGAEARRTRAQVELGTAGRALERARALLKERATTTAELDDATATKAGADADLALAEAEIARARADVDVLKVRLEERLIRAPAAGKIAAVYREAGAFVSRGDAVLDVVAAGALEIRFTVSESDAAAVRAGDPLTMRALGREFSAVVRRVGAALDPASRALPVEAEVTGEVEGLLPGMYVDVQLRTALPEGLATVPVSALVGRGADREVFRIVPDAEGGASVKAVAVRVLADDGKRAAVTQLSVGEKVVVAGARDLKDEMKVEIVERAP